MRIIIFFCVLFFCTGYSAVAQQNKLTYIPDKTGDDRIIPPGRGPVYDRVFQPISTYYFVQFGVYPDIVNPATIKAPRLGDVWLIHHPRTRVKTINGEKGAYYIVKAYASQEKATSAVKELKKQGYDCWFNADLSNQPFTIWGIKN